MAGRPLRSCGEIAGRADSHVASETSHGTGRYRAGAAISVENLGFSFPGRSSRVLKNISLDIAEGECVVVTGPSGCGKSTLALAMAGYIPHVIEGRLSGEVRVCGRNTVDTALCDLAVTVSLCQQDPESQLCTLTVEDEVRFGPENLALPVAEVLRREAEALGAVGALYLKGREVLQLSGGEKQRIAIASMLSMKPRVLILDEPTSNLDPDAAHEVMLAIETLRNSGKITLIIIEHRLDRLLEPADRLIVLVDGEVRLDGPPAEVYREYALMLEEAPRRADIPCAPPAATSCEQSPILQVRDLRFGYGEREVLRGISLTARRGEFIGIIGANGSGKTTFLGCLAGLNLPVSGEVVVCGANTRDVKPSAIARSVGFVFQNPNHQIFENTVEEEVVFAGANFRMDSEGLSVRAQRVMTQFDLISYRAYHPLRLSHGEKRRLNLCSVLPHEPSLIILDEPFIGQDRRNSARIMREVLRLRESGRALLVVSHDIDMVFDYCTRIVLFEGGRVLVDDIPREACKKIRELGKLNFLPGARCL